MPLLKAYANDGNFDMFKLLWENVLDVNERKNGFEAILVHAARNPEIVKYLLKKVKINNKTLLDKLLIQVSGTLGAKEEYIKYLLDKGAKATDHALIATMKYIRENGLSLMGWNDFFLGPGPEKIEIMRSEIEEHKKIVELLINRGAYVKVKNAVNLEEELNSDLLSSATSSGYLEIVQMLVNAGADVNGNNMDGNPLRFAVTYGYERIVEFLLDRNANVNLKRLRNLALVRKEAYKNNLRLSSKYDTIIRMLSESIEEQSKG